MKIVADNTVPFLKGIAEPIAEVKYLTSKEFTPVSINVPANCSKEAG